MHCTGGLQVDFCGQTEGIGKRNREVQTQYFAEALEAFGYVRNKNLLAEHTKRLKILTAPAKDNAVQLHKLAVDACHQKSAQGDSSFLKRISACPECGDLFLMRDALDGHLQQVHKQRNQRGLHKKKHGGRQSFECQFCQKLFMKREHLDFHLRNHADERNHVSLPNKTKIGEKPFQCQFCRMGFNRRELRDRHLRTHLKKTSWARSDISAQTVGNVSRSSLIWHATRCCTATTHALMCVPTVAGPSHKSISSFNICCPSILIKGHMLAYCVGGRLHQQQVQGSTKTCSTIITCITVNCVAKSIPQKVILHDTCSRIMN
ncbi:oocyte zinc finger protein XlCOF20 isoform X2 [Rhipicephalus sanguineus]|uniref:oocyte zinc finger protein XlCOF20 isoform X2 n=1 Tax=Rhipicephalus sanguineus TaxID=34632 RepID=UPI0018952DE5|nr:oocyte zinc finger protein XlCOF20 isoform X2 [Rhipicephalus sanguineus]